jgi:hypothetical protein
MKPSRSRCSSSRVGVVANGKRRGRKPRAPALDIRALTSIVEDELLALWEELQPPSLSLWAAEDLETFLQSHRQQLKMCARIERLLDRLDSCALWTPYQIKWRSWCYVCEGLDEFELESLDAYKFASNMLKGTPAEAEWQMMKKRYDKMQQILPESERRPPKRTRRRQA